METREDGIYQKNKGDVSALTRNLDERVKQSDTVASSLVGRSAKLTELLSSTDSNPLIAVRARIRRKLHSLIPTGHTLEVCLRTDNPLIESSLSTTVPDVGSGIRVTVVSSEFATQVPDLPQAESRVDQIVLIQVLDIADSTGRTVRIRVRQPMFLKWVGANNPELHFAPLSTPRVDGVGSDGELVVPDISAKIVSAVFANKVTGKVDFKLPAELANKGLTGKALRARDGLVRVYYSKSRSVEQASDGATPTISSAMTIKLTRSLMMDLFLPKVRDAMAAAEVNLDNFDLQFDLAHQLMYAVIVASKGFGKYIGNVKITAKGNARVRQAVAPSAANAFALIVKSIGDAVLVGDPWPSDVKAHMDTLIGGGVGVSVPDEGTDLVWAFAKSLGAKLPGSIPSQTFSEAIPVSPLQITSVKVRNADLSLELR